MVWILVVLPVVLGAFGILIWPLCSVAADADRRIELMIEEMQRSEGEKKE